MATDIPQFKIDAWQENMEEIMAYVRSRDVDLEWLARDAAAMHTAISVALFMNVTPILGKSYDTGIYLKDNIYGGVGAFKKANAFFYWDGKELLFYIDIDGVYHPVNTKFTDITGTECVVPQHQTVVMTEAFIFLKYAKRFLEDTTGLKQVYQPMGGIDNGIFWDFISCLEYTNNRSDFVCNDDLWNDFVANYGDKVCTKNIFHKKVKAMINEKYGHVDIKLKKVNNKAQRGITGFKIID